MKPKETSSPPPKHHSHQTKWVKPFLQSFIIATILIALVILTAPFWVRSRKNTDKTEAVSNAKQIGQALIEFEKEYGVFPSAATAADVTASDPTHTFKLSGNSSNFFFRQLFAAQLTESESIFYAKTKDCRRPDGIITPGEALKKGEVGFAYISGLSSSSIGNPARPVVLTPLIPGTTKFDPKPLKGHAVALRMDGSVVSYKIAKDGHVYIGGIDLLSPKDPIWDGKAPVIHYPE